MGTLISARIVLYALFLVDRGRTGDDRLLIAACFRIARSLSNSAPASCQSQLASLRNNSDNPMICTRRSLVPRAFAGRRAAKPSERVSLWTKSTSVAGQCGASHTCRQHHSSSLWFLYLHVSFRWAQGGGETQSRECDKMSFEIEMQPPSPEIQAIAQKELRETEENVREGIAALKKFLEEDTTIFFRTDDEFLMIFLRPTKFYAQSAYELMKRVADFKEKNVSLLHNLMPQDEKSALLESNVVNVMKGRDHKGRRILFVNAGRTWDPSKVKADQIIRIFYLIHELAMLEPTTQICGSVVIMDFDGLSMKQVLGLTPSFSMKLLNFIQDSMPLRLKEVHIVKQPYLFNMVWTMFKPFIREKLKKRMFFHGAKMSSLHTHLAPSHLPKNYGGELPEIDYGSANWYPILVNHEDRIKEWNSFGYRKAQ